MVGMGGRERKEREGREREGWRERGGERDRGGKGGESEERGK